MSTICKNTCQRQELPCINCTCESSDSTAELDGSTCVIEQFRFDADIQKKMLRAFVEAELCPCAVETFNANSHRTVELTVHALYCAVINEMVLRSTATAVAEQANTEVRG